MRLEKVSEHLLKKGGYPRMRERERRPKVGAGCAARTAAGALCFGIVRSLRRITGGRLDY